jgi:hypothetical protein
MNISVTLHFHIKNTATCCFLQALCYKPEGRGSSPDEAIEHFSIYLILLVTLWSSG